MSKVTTTFTHVHSNNTTEVFRVLKSDLSSAIKRGTVNDATTVKELVDKKLIVSRGLITLDSKGDAKVSLKRAGGLLPQSAAEKMQVTVNATQFATVQGKAKQGVMTTVSNAIRRADEIATELKRTSTSLLKSKDDKIAQLEAMLADLQKSAAA